MAEAGYPGYAVDAWFGLVTSVKAPPDVLDKLSTSVMSVIKTPEVRNRLEQFGYDPIGNSAAEFGATLRADIDKFARVIKAAGIKADI